MNEELVLNRIEFHTFKKSIGFGINIDWNSFFKNYQSRNKVQWLSLTIHLLFWQVTLRWPVKLYGIQS